MQWCNIFVLAVAETKPLTLAKTWISDVARNFRLPNRGGEIDLIGWDRDVLCFIEVKTRHLSQPQIELFKNAPSLA